MKQTITAEVETAAEFHVDRDPASGQPRIWFQLGEAGGTGPGIVLHLADDTAAGLALALCDVLAAGPGEPVAVTVPPTGYSPGRIREALLPALRAQRATLTHQSRGGVA